mgnify:CR=1 FL=1|tara:strand:- start:1963 stop:2511 length:549 start_codon:yes stop_codon:yes gene_type:complete
MNNPALKREVSKDKKMLSKITPRLRRFNVVVNSFDSCVSDTPKEFSRTPEISSSKVVSQPRMFFEKFKGTVPFKQLKGPANTRSRRQLNKQMDMINSNVEFINFNFSPISYFPQEELAVHSQPVELERVFRVFNFPHKVEGILSEAMLPRFQIHFLPSIEGTPIGASPKSAKRKKAHAKLIV